MKEQTKEILKEKFNKINTPWFYVLVVIIGAMIIAGSHLTSASIETLKPAKLNQDYTILQTCADATYINISVSNLNGLFITNQQMTKNGSIWTYNFTPNSLGRYDVGYISDGCEESGASYFEVTPNGEAVTIGKAVFYIGLLAVLVFFFAVCIYSFSSFDNLLSRVGMLGLGYLLLLAITFIGWNMAQDFLTSSPFLVEMLRILFFVLIIGLFPLLIGAFAWYVIMLFKIKEIERLMDKGFSEEDANRRVKNGKK